MIPCPTFANAHLVTTMLLSFLVKDQASFLPGNVYTSLTEGAVVDLISFCQVLFKTGIFDADVVCIALTYVRTVIKKNNISNPLFLARMFQVAITLAAKYHDDFSVSDTTYRQLVPHYPVLHQEFMNLQFFFLEQLHYNMDMSFQQVAAIRGIFGSMTAKTDWVHEVMDVLKAKKKFMTLFDLVIIVEMSEWWLDLYPTRCRRPILAFMADLLESVPADTSCLILEYCCERSKHG